MSISQLQLALNEIDRLEFILIGDNPCESDIFNSPKLHQYKFASRHLQSMSAVK
ncbi:hypothetical protein DOY81_003959, partial [Sarcophaga bullata]